MKVKVIFYGGLQRVVDARQLEIEFSEQNLELDKLSQHLIGQYPEIKKHMKSVVYSIGDSVVNNSHVVSDGDEVGLLPPVSGG